MPNKQMCGAAPSSTSFPTTITSHNSSARCVCVGVGFIGRLTGLSEEEETFVGKFHTGVAGMYMP